MPDSPFVGRLRAKFGYDAERGVLLRGDKPTGTPHPTLGYLVVRHERKTYYVHRVIWMLVHGEWPGQIDHIDHDRTNNRLANLRDVTDAQNKQNLPIARNNTSGATGVWFHRQRGKWAAEIKVSSQKHHLGLFEDFDAAVSARAAAKARLHPYGVPSA